MSWGLESSVVLVEGPRAGEEGSLVVFCASLMLEKKQEPRIGAVGESSLE